MLKLDKICRSGLEPVSLTLRSGECMAISGPSGSGKSLLLRAIADIDPNEGTASLNGISREDMTGPEWRRQVSYLPAESGWWSDLVRDHMLDRTHSLPLMQSLGLPEEAFEWSVPRLSTGERQRLALVRALSGDPKVLLLDEPTAALDTINTEAVEEIIRSRIASGVSVVLVTHDQVQAQRLAKSFFKMVGGRLSGPYPTPCSDTKMVEAAQ